MHPEQPVNVSPQIDNHIHPSLSDTLTKKVRYPLALLALTLIVGSLVIFSTTITNQLRSWRLLPQPESLTELYFTSPLSLPTHYRAGSAQPVAFTVHNLENQTERYNYAIVASTASGAPPQLLNSGSFVLEQGAYQHIADTVLLGPLGRRVKVSVTLINQNEAIHYWLYSIRQ
jgi:hypothetical protein